MPLLLLALAACTGSPDGGRAPGPDPATSFADVDEDGWPAGPDCDDADPAVHPDADEVCNGRDDDCDPLTIEAPDLASLAVAPHRAVAHLCPGAHVGNVRLVGQELTVVGGPYVDVAMYDVSRPAFEVLGGSLTLEDVVLHGTAIGYYDQASAIRVAEGGRLTVRRGTFELGIASMGGVILAQDATVTIEDSTFQSNLATSATGGGAIAAFGSEVAVHGSRFWDNVGDRGGAILVEGGALTVASSVLTMNQGQSGGAIEATDAVVRVSDAVFRGNVAADGGALAALSSTIELLDVELRENVAQYGDGGAIFVAGGEGSLTNVTMVDNQSSLEGGGMHAQGATLDGRFVYVDGNLAMRGGGVSLAGGTTVHATGWTISGNGGWGEGGGISVAASSFLGDASTVIQENWSDAGGGAAVTQSASVLTAGAVQDGEATKGGGIWVRTFGEPVTIAAAVRRNFAFEGGGVHVEAGEALFSGELLENTANGIWLANGASVTAAAEWGADDEDNLGGDVASGQGLSWSASGFVEVRCDAAACEVDP